MVIRARVSVPFTQVRSMAGGLRILGTPFTPINIARKRRWQCLTRRPISSPADHGRSVLNFRSGGPEVLSAGYL